MLVIGGAILVSGDQPDLPVYLGPGLFLLASFIWLIAISVLYSRVRPTVATLSRGQLHTGRITRVLDRSTGEYIRYGDALVEFRKFSTMFSSGIIGLLLGTQMKNWPAKIILEGSTHEIDAELDLGNRMMHLVQDPETVFLVSNQERRPTIVMPEQFPWLDIGVTDSRPHESKLSGEDEEVGFGKSLARAFLVVLVTYSLTALGLAFNMKPLFNAGMDHETPAIVGAGVVLMFTLTHAVLPVFFYSIFTSVIGLFSAAKDAAHHTDAQVPGSFLFLISAFTYLHFGFWYGIPILGLAGLTGWLNLGWVLLDVLRAGTGRRAWAFLQHGSTSVALGLFLVCFSGKDLFPLGIIVVVLQALLLSVIEWKGKAFWIKE